MRNMRRAAVLTVVTMAVLAGTLTAAPRQGGRRGNKTPEVSLLDQLVRECKIPEAQQAALKAKIKAYDDALAAWDKTNAAKIQAAEAAAKEARSGSDADAKKKAFTTTRELKNARNEAAATAKATVLAALKDDQKTAWAAYELCKTTVGRYRRAELTEEQLARIKTACAIAVKEISAADGDSKATKTINANFRWAINAMVLTPQQREAMGKAPAGRGGKNKGPQ